MRRIRLFIVPSLVFLVSCEKDINIKLDETQPKLVVDGSIENGRPALITLSSSLDYFSKITPEILASTFVHGAKLTLSDGSRTHVLREDSVLLTTGIFYYYYTNDPTDPATAIIGQLSTSYSLKIEKDGKTYTATTTIPAITRKIDSLWVEKGPDNLDSNLVRMMIRATDKPGFGDYIRYFTKANSEPFYPGFNSVFDDQIIDGKTYTIQVDRGVNKNFEVKDEDIYFRKGDTATLKLCNIDKATYDFWRTFEFNFQSIGNPFSSPTKVSSNISNGALGYFGGYAAQYRTIIIPR